MDNYDLLATVLGLSAHFAAIFLPKLHRKWITPTLNILIIFADDFTIFSIIVPSLSIFVFLITYDCCPWASSVVLTTFVDCNGHSPDLRQLFCLFWEHCGWVSSASMRMISLLINLKRWARGQREFPAYTSPQIDWNAKSDIIGHIQCDGLVGQRTATKNGDSSVQFLLPVTRFDLFYVSVPATEFCYEMKVIEAFSWMLFVLFAIALYMVLRLVTEAERFGRYDIWWAPIQGANYYLL